MSGPWVPCLSTSRNRFLRSFGHPLSTISPWTVRQKPQNEDMNLLDQQSPPEQPSALRVEDAARRPRRFRLFWINAALITTAIVVGGVWLTAQQTGPTIRWSSVSVLEFLQPGEKRQITITFISSQDMASASASVTPSLASVVSVSPQSLGRIRAGRENRITLEFTAPSQSQIKFEGTLHIRSGQPPGNTFAQPLAVTIIIHNEPVPRDPGEAGKATIEGIDSDGDGVRDDAQRWIVENTLARPDVRSALTQYARADQKFITHSNESQNTIVDITQMRNQAHDCLNYIMGSPSNALALYSELEPILLNTRERSVAYAIADQKLGGVFFPISDPTKWNESCE